MTSCRNVNGNWSNPPVAENPIARSTRAKAKGVTPVAGKGSLRFQHTVVVLASIVLSMQPLRLTAQPSPATDFGAMARILTNKSADRIERENVYTEARHLGTNAYPLVPALIVVVSAKANQYERELATEVIAAIGRRAKRATISLMRVVEDKAEHPGLRTKAIRAIGCIGPDGDEAVPALVRLLDPTNSTPLQRIEAVVALGRLGPVARQSIPGLLVLLSSDDREETELLTQVAKTLGGFSHHARDALEPLSRKFSDRMVDIAVFEASLGAFMQIFEETWTNPDRTDSDLILLHDCGRVVERRFLELRYPECLTAAEKLRDWNSKIAIHVATRRAAVAARERWWTQLPWFVWVVGGYLLYLPLLRYIVKPLLLKRKPLWIFLANSGLRKFPEVPVPKLPGVTIGLRSVLRFKDACGDPRVLDAWVDRHFTTLKSHFKPPRTELTQSIKNTRQECVQLIQKKSVVRALFLDPAPESLANALGSAILKEKNISIVLSPDQLDPATFGDLVTTVRERLRVIAGVEDGEKWLPRDFLQILLQKKRVVVVLAGFDEFWPRAQKLVKSPDISSVNALVVTCRDLPQEAREWIIRGHTNSPNHTHEDKYIAEPQ